MLTDYKTNWPVDDSDGAYLVSLDKDTSIIEAADFYARIYDDCIELWRNCPLFDKGDGVKHPQRELVATYSTSSLRANRAGRKRIFLRPLTKKEIYQLRRARLKAEAAGVEFNSTKWCFDNLDKEGLENA